MTNLIETMTQAIRALRFGSMTASPAREQARAALAAIEAAGYRVVPMELTTDQRAACRDCLVDSAEPGDLYAAMLAAAPKVTE